MDRLQNKVAIVTGASSGIGLATADLFLAEGAKVAMVSRPSEHFQKIAEKNSGREGIALPYDISIESNWDEIVAKTLEAFGKIDILVNNAGIGLHTSGSYVDDFAQSSFDKVFSVNYYGAVYGMNRVLPKLQKGGSIVNVASVSGLHPIGDTAYSMTKAALINTTQQQALFWSQKGIRINCVCPGVTETNITAHVLSNPDSARYKRLLNMKMLAPVGKPEQIAKSILFLASDESDWITGIALVIDGGAMLN
jgi:NAD(P)-dependent dehydrogenase (short-subunit alcohol dehydrogenase family)